MKPRLIGQPLFVVAVEETLRLSKLVAPAYRWLR
jgi:hypothetical protein